MQKRWMMSKIFQEYAAYCMMFFFSLMVSTSFAREPKNLSIAKSEVVQYHDSGAYVADINQQITKAKKYLAERIAQHQKRADKKRLAVVFDVDETALSNYKYMFQLNFGGTWAQILKTHSDDTAIQPTLSLYNFAKQNHVAVFFITGRPDKTHDITVKNLRQAGYKDWDGLFCKPASYHEKSVVSFKKMVRQELVQEGYDIVLDIGDQYSDLQGGYADRVYKLSDPYYYLP